MNLFDSKRNAYMLNGSLAKKGYLRWWHSFKGIQPVTGKERVFFVEYFIINPALSSDHPILGQHPFYKKRGFKPSYVMIKVGAFPDDNGNNGIQLHAFYPISAIKMAHSPLHIEIGDCIFSETHIAGYVDVNQTEAKYKAFMTDAGCMEWDLNLYKDIACHTGVIANRFFTSINALESFWHGEGIRTLFRGTVTINGEPYEVNPEDCHGYADKHWGRNFNQPWLQLASCHFRSEKTGKELKHSALAIDGCCPRFLGLPLKRKLMIQLTYTGEDFEYNFARPSLLSRCRWKVITTNKRYIWHIKAQNRNSIIKLSLSSPRALMMPLNYESPDGIKSKRPILAGGNGIGTIEIYRRSSSGKQLIDTLTILDGLCEYQKTNCSVRKN